MFDIINPYNALAFYKTRTEASQCCPIYSGRTLPGFQIPISLTDANFTFMLIDEAGNDVTVDNNSFTALTPIVNGKRWYTFIPTFKQINIDGVFQIKFSSDEIDSYWSNALSIRNKFSVLNTQIGCTGSSANFEIELKALGCDYALWEVDHGSGFVRIGQTTGIVSAELVGARAGAVSLPVKCTFVTDTQITTRTYNLTYTGEDPCSDKALTQTAVTTERTETARFSYLEFWHDKNFEEKNINYVESAYKQRFYFEANFDHITRIEEEAFQTLYDGSFQFNYTNEAEQVNIDIYPCPGYLVNAINQGRYHLNCDLIDCQTAERFPVSNLKLVMNKVEGSDCQRGRMTFEINRAYSKNS